MVIKSSFDPKIKWVLPEGAVPYKPNDAPDGTEHTLLRFPFFQKDYITLFKVQTMLHPAIQKRKYVYSNVRGFA